MLVVVWSFAASQPSPPWADLPPIELSATINGTASSVSERDLNQGSSSLVLRLAGDTFAASALTAASAAASAVLGAFESLQPHEPAGWAAVVSPVLRNGSLEMVSTSEIALRLPRLGCFDLLYPEVVTVRLPGAATYSGRAVIAPSLRIRADAVRPPRWGSVRHPPWETWRNCTHVRLAWRPPLDSGGTRLVGYRLEWRSVTAADAAIDPSTEPLAMGPALDDGWNSTELIAAEASDENGAIADASATLGPLMPGSAYLVRVRAFSEGTGCSLIAGDDGQSLALYAGWQLSSRLQPS